MHTYVHTNIQTCVHTYIHTLIHIPLGVVPHYDRLVGAAREHVARVRAHEGRKLNGRDGAAVARKGLPEARCALRVENVPQLDEPVRPAAVEEEGVGLDFERGHGPLVHVPHVAQLVVGGGGQDSLGALILAVIAAADEALPPPDVDSARAVPAYQDIFLRLAVCCVFVLFLGLAVCCVFVIVAHAEHACEAGFDGARGARL
jgi:hypothetical protein